MKKKIKLIIAWLDFKLVWFTHPHDIDYQIEIYHKYLDLKFKK